MCNVCKTGRRAKVGVVGRQKMHKSYSFKIKILVMDKNRRTRKRKARVHIMDEELRWSWSWSTYIVRSVPLCRTSNSNRQRSREDTEKMKLILYACVYATMYRIENKILLSPASSALVQRKAKRNLVLYTIYNFLCDVRHLKLITYNFPLIFPVTSFIIVPVNRLTSSSKLQPTIIRWLPTPVFALTITSQNPKQYLIPNT